MLDTENEKHLPDYYVCVAQEMIEKCGPDEGIWVDLGSGEGPVGFALAELSESFVVLIDPNGDALAEATSRARRCGCDRGMLAVHGRAEDLPLADGSVDLVVSRGSIFFWEDRPTGIREVHRVLRPGGRAMLGGGLGRDYPLWARREFIRRRRESQRRKGPAAMREFREVRKPETFRGWAREAELSDFRVVGEGGLPPEDADTGVGIWLLFTKENE
ncbi:MAG: class I SAM-dependent methyltransferase [Candidatus Brocadiia bacterium]